MKKIVVILMTLLMVGCSDSLEVEVGNLTSELNQVKEEVKILEEKNLDLQDQVKKSQTSLEVCRQENEEKETQVDFFSKKVEELEEDKLSLIKRLTEIEFDSYEAQLNFDIHIVQKFGGYRYVLENSTIPHARIYNVIGYQADLNNLQEADQMTLEMGDDSYEVASFLVEGEIYNFKWVSITWNDNYTEYSVDEIIEEIDLVKNQRINIRTMLPETFSFQMVTFENSLGEEFVQHLHYDGYGFEGLLIITE